MKKSAEIKPGKLSALMRMKLAMLWVAALVAPGAALPAAKRVRDQAPVDVALKEFPDDAVFDDEYQGEEFYRGLPIFDKEGNRCTLHPGKEYVDSYLQLPSGHILQCWREAGHAPVVIDKARIPAA